MFKRAKRKVPGLNTSSTADISFMLLILFLVTTSMEVDEGLERTLPPIEKQQKETQSMVDERLVLRFQILDNNKLLLNNKPIALATVRKTVANFVAPKGKEHIIQLQADSHASYNTYFSLQNSCMANSINFVLPNSKNRLPTKYRNAYQRFILQRMQKHRKEATNEHLSTS